MRSQPTLKSETADNHIHGSRSSRGNKHFFSAVARDSGRSPCVRRAHGGEPLRTNGRARSRVRRIVSYSPAGQTTAGCRLIGYAEARMKESPPGPSNPGPLSDPAPISTACCAARSSTVSIVVCGAGRRGTPAYRCSFLIRDEIRSNASATPTQRSAVVSNRSRRTATSSTAVSTTTTTTTTTTEPANFFSEPAVTQYLAERSGNITAALYDVTTGTPSLWRPGLDEDTASIVKVDTLATLLHQDQTSGTSLSANEESLATSMIEISDNDAATDLWDDAGQATGIGSFDSLLDLNSTVPGSDGYWGLTQTTASDQIELPQSLVLPNQVLDAGSRAYELGLMEQVTSSEDWGVSSGVPQGVTVALKNGWLPLTATNWRINSVGWIDGQGRDYLLAVLTDGNPTESYGIDTIQGISSLAWAALAP
jgi:hypothetical protein